jgi:hypothetical protein
MSLHSLIIAFLLLNTIFYTFLTNNKSNTSLRVITKIELETHKAKIFYISFVNYILKNYLKKICLILSY